jgi:hypothetical protein
VLWHNLSSLGADPIYLRGTVADPAIVYCNLEGGGGNIHRESGDTLYTGIFHDNLDTVPLFADTAAGDFRLLETSACIDAGTPDTAGLGLPPLDPAGNPRIDGGRVDMGPDAVRARAGSRFCGTVPIPLIRPPPSSMIRGRPGTGPWKFTT